MPFSDNKDFWKEFIEIYESFPCLWDVKKKDYSNKHLKNEALDILIEKCKSVFPNANKEFVEKKIKSLRASFRRELRKVIKSKGTGTSADDVYQPSLWYYDLLLFTADCEVVRDGTSNMAQVSHSEDEENSTEINNLPSPSIPSTSSNISATLTRRRITTSTTQKPSLEKRKETFLQIASNFLKDDGKDDAIYGKNVELQLKEMDVKQRIIAEKLIAEVIFYGKLGHLTEESAVVKTPAPAPPPQQSPRAVASASAPMHNMFPTYPYGPQHAHAPYWNNYPNPYVPPNSSQPPGNQQERRCNEQANLTTFETLTPQQSVQSSSLGSDHNFFQQDNASENPNFNMDELLVFKKS